MRYLYIQVEYQAEDEVIIPLVIEIKADLPTCIEISEEIVLRGEVDERPFYLTKCRADQSDQTQLVLH